MKAALLLIILAFVAFAQKPSPLTLSDAEQKQWAQFNKEELATQQSMGQAENTLLNTPAEQASCASIQLHSNFQQIGLQLNLLRARREAFVWRLRAEKGCADCLIDEDGKKLITPPKATQ